MKAPVMLLLHFLTMPTNHRPLVKPLSNEAKYIASWLLLFFTRYNIHALTLFVSVSCFPMLAKPLNSKLAQRLLSLQDANNVGNISCQHQQNITPLLPVILLKLVLLKLQSHKRPHQPVKFSMHPAPPPAGYYLLVPAACTPKHQTSTINKLLLLLHLHHHNSKSIQKVHSLQIYSCMGFCCSRPNLNISEISLRWKKRELTFLVNEMRW